MQTSASPGESQPLLGMSDKPERRQRGGRYDGGNELEY